MRFKNEKHGALRVHQFANDWISVDGPSGPEIVSPRQVRVETDEEFKLFRDSMGDKSSGLFWVQWELTDEGFFQETQEWKDWTSRAPEISELTLEEWISELSRMKRDEG